jgi:hypothetical protein
MILNSVLYPFNDGATYWLVAGGVLGESSSLQWNFNTAELAGPLGVDRGAGWEVISGGAIQGGFRLTAVPEPAVQFSIAGGLLLLVSCLLSTKRV